MSTIVPPPLGLGRPTQNNKKYKLVVVQNPVRARCCGFGEKDRRPVDPPPILQLFIERPDGTLQNANDDDSNFSLFVVQCDLYSENGQELRTHVYNPSANFPADSTVDSSGNSFTRNQQAFPSAGTLLTFQDPTPTRSLMGALVSNAYQLTNEQNEMGIYFIFPDLSVRPEGRFCLKFIFIDLSAGDPLTMSTQVSNYVLSRPFTVYSAKNFPGMTDSTSLSQCFAQQGIKISIRKGRRIRRLVGTSRKRAKKLADTTPSTSIIDDKRPIEDSNQEEFYNIPNVETLVASSIPISEEQQQPSTESNKQSSSSSSSTYRTKSKRMDISSFLSPSE